MAFGFTGLAISQSKTGAATKLTRGPKYRRAYRPRSLVLIGGTQFTPISWSAHLSAFGDVDTCDITLPLSICPDFGKRTTTGNSMPVKVYAGFPANPRAGRFSYADLELRFAGVVDVFNVTAEDNKLVIPCRSNGALLADTKTTARWQNVSTTFVVQQIAKEHGLTAVIKLRSGQQAASIGQVWQRNFILATRDIYEWDVIIASSLIDDVRVWIEGTTLYYVAPEDAPANRLYVQWNKDLITLGGQHSPQFSKNIEVEVRTWSPIQRTSTRAIIGTDASGNVKASSRTISAVSQPVFGTRTVETSEVVIGSDGSVKNESGTATTTGGAASTGLTREASASLVERYIEHVSNMSRQDAINYALAKWRQISAHTFNCNFKRPMTPEVLPLVSRTTIFCVQNAPWASLDLPYHALRIMENFGVAETAGGMSEGWTFEVDGVNHVPQQQGI